MKIKIKKIDFDKFSSLESAPHKKPKRPSRLLQTVIRIASIPDMLKTRFTYNMSDADVIRKTPCLILMNHTAFIDMEIASAIFYPKLYNVVSTIDTLIGKELLMRYVGCIPTKKFVSDPTLISDMKYSLHELGVSVLMYPEAIYSFDGRGATIPARLGFLAKRLGVPVVMVKTNGVFAHNPLYNCLQRRKAKITADVSMIISAEDAKTKTVDELDAAIEGAFKYDSFAWQKENEVHVTESFRADGLHRILYKCTSCGKEGAMKGEGTTLTCGHCSAKWELDTLGGLVALNTEGKFEHIPDWVDWQKEEICREVNSGEYGFEAPVKIYGMKDFRAMYELGEGTLKHTSDGFKLTGLDGRLAFAQTPLSSYTIGSDYYWYEIGDTICVGDSTVQYYCVVGEDVSVAKARWAAEEIYKIKLAEKRSARTR